MYCTVLVPRRIFGAEVERAQIHGFVGLVVFPVKRNADKAALQHVTALDVDLDRAFREACRRARSTVAFPSVTVTAPGVPATPTLAIHRTQPSHRQLLCQVELLRAALSGLGRPDGPFPIAG